VISGECFEEDKNTSLRLKTGIAVHDIFLG